MAKTHKSKAKATSRDVTFACTAAGDFTYSDESLTANPDDVIRWKCDDGDFSVDFMGDSPTDKLKDHEKKSHWLRMQVRSKNSVAQGVYKYLVAVARPEGVFTDDPEVEIEY